MNSRPKINSKEVAVSAARLLLPKVMSWLKVDEGKYKDEDIINDLACAMRYHSDGFEIAERLKGDFYWEPDAMLVDILDCHHKHECYKDLVREWVKENDIKPQLMIGQSVEYKDPFKIQNGVITKIHYDTAEYEIFSESLGHVKEGCGTYGVIIPYESVNANDK